MPQASAREKLIVALDFPSAETALALVERLEGRCLWFKVGLELYLAAGPGIVHTLREMGFEVFLDLKLHDIPNTVAGAVTSLASSGASLLTVHTLGGPAMLAAAQRAVRQSAGHRAPSLLGVTILTSMDASQLTAVGLSASPAQEVARLARLAQSAGLAGIVCSPQEVAPLRAQLASAEPELLFVVPGIRPAGYAADDQSRIAAPALAIAAGASMLVVGRPITRSPDPASAAASILQQIDAATQSSAEPRLPAQAV